MAKDERDKQTIDMIEKKMGRPLIYPEWGPMTEKERQERSRAGRVSIRFFVDEKDRDKLDKYIKRHGGNRNDFIKSVINSLRLTKPTF